MKEKKDNIRISEEQAFLNDLRGIVANGRRKGYEAVNQVIVVCNWLIGRRIVVQEQQGKGRAEYGKHVIDIASKYLTEVFGKGYSASNLRNYRQFYLMFGDLIPNLPNAFGELMDTKIYQTRLANLSWSHYEQLIRVRDDEARHWYMDEAQTENWSVRTLHRNISSQYYQRLLLTKPEAKSAVIGEMQNLTAKFQNDKLAFLKNPIVAEFLGLPQNTSYTETDLETAIINHLQQFIMELGKGYAFVARQKHIKTDMGDYYIDLVFYNFKMRCFVLIDLKTSQITHQDVGQMDMYRRMYDAMERNKDDNPTIGLLLCAETSKDLAQYSILHDSDQLFAAKYMTFLPKREELLAEIEYQKQIFLMQKSGQL